MRMSAFSLALIFLAVPCKPQDTAQPTAYELKGFTLGVSTLDDFKNKFHHCADVCKSKTPKFAPLCSDDYPNSGQTPDHANSAEAWTKAGLVFCQPYFPFESFQGELFTIADIRTKSYFYFFQSRLYGISAAFVNHGSEFRAMLEAFTGKYGQPTSQEMRDYQNSFGAKFTGRIITWDNGVSRIVLTEFGADRDTSAVEFVHPSLKRAAEAAAPKHSSKDL